MNKKIICSLVGVSLCMVFCFAPVYAVDYGHERFRAVKAWEYQIFELHMKYASQIQSNASWGGIPGVTYTNTSANVGNNSAWPGNVFLRISSGVRMLYQYNLEPGETFYFYGFFWPGTMVYYDDGAWVSSAQSNQVAIGVYVGGTDTDHREYYISDTNYGTIANFLITEFEYTNESNSSVGIQLVIRNYHNSNNCIWAPLLVGTSDVIRLDSYGVVGGEGSGEVDLSNIESLLTNINNQTDTLESQLSTIASLESSINSRLQNVQNAIATVNQNLTTSAYTLTLDDGSTESVASGKWLQRIFEKIANLYHYYVLNNPLEDSEVEQMAEDLDDQSDMIADTHDDIEDFNDTYITSWNYNFEQLDLDHTGLDFTNGDYTLNTASNWFGNRLNDIYNASYGFKVMFILPFIFALLFGIIAYYRSQKSHWGGNRLGGSRAAARGSKRSG